MTTLLCGLFAIRFSFTASWPILLKPYLKGIVYIWSSVFTYNLIPNYLFITAESSFNLNTLGFEFPGWGIGVTDPISINPNPIFANPLNASASLSNPAAKPMGIGKSKPSTLEALDNYKSFTYYPSNKYSVAVFLCWSILTRILQSFGAILFENKRFFFAAQMANWCPVSASTIAWDRGITT